MLTVMERSSITLLHKRGLPNTAIATLVGHDRGTIARVLQEPIDRSPVRRQRRSQVDVLTEDIQRWLTDGLPIQRMLELAWAHPAHPYAGKRSAFYARVDQIRQTWAHQHGDVPLRFEGLPGEYLQVDWGEVRRFPFDQQPTQTRYFYAARLKYSRWMQVHWQANMHQETLLRCLAATFVLLGGVPWVCVFDNMKTVTAGRDATQQPLWHPVFQQFAVDFGFLPHACAPRAAQQKGSVENLVKFVQSNFLPGRTFWDDADLADQTTAWLQQVNTQPSQATDQPPLALLPAEHAVLSPLPPEAADYGLGLLAQADRESLVPVEGMRYSVPLPYAKSPVTVRLHQTRVRIYHEATLIADHQRRTGPPGRVIDPAHFEPVLARKPQARVLLYRDYLLALGEPASTYIPELCRRRYAQQTPEILALYALAQQYPVAALLAAMQRASAVGAYGTEYLQALLAQPTSTWPTWTPLVVPATPSQPEVDRPLAVYDAHVTTVRGGT